MRVLFTCFSATGHFHPLVPLAQGLAGAGHEVAFMATAGFAPQVGASGFRCFETSFSNEDLVQTLGGPGLPSSVRRERFMQRMFPEVAPQHLLPDLLSLYARWAPDLVISENHEFAGRVAAEHWGIPHASVKVGNVYPYGERHTLVPAMDRLRAMATLPPDPDAAMLFRHLYIVNEPPSLQLAAELLPPTAVRLRRTTFDQSGAETRPDWLADLAAQLTVYATMGTVVNKRPDLLESILAALRAEPINLMLTVGRDRDPAAFGDQPPNVHIERYIPQSLVFDVCDLVVSHCGAGSMLAALEHGLPMVNIPITADQPENAMRCTALGVGITVGPAERTAEAIRAAVRMVLADPRYRANARRLQAEIAALPGPETAVTLLEQLSIRHPAVRPIG